jgi:MoxR-like ATPase
LALADITEQSVRQAIEQFDRLGRDAFLEEYGFGRAREYFLVSGGRRYDSKAIAGAAHGFARPDEGPLGAWQFGGGESGAAGELRRLGFTVEQTRSPAVWWVNQGATYQHERDGGYLWAPLKTKGGYAAQHHANVGKLQPGDVIINYANSKIRALSRSVALPQVRDRPAALPAEPWAAEGYQASVEYYELTDPIDISELSERPFDAGPFDKEGSVKQVYLVPVDADFAESLRSTFAARWPSDSPWGGRAIAPSPATQTTHLLLKWSATSKPDTVQLHEQVAMARGSVWWGKFGRGIAAQRLKELDDQLRRDKPTHVYLIGGGALWRTELQQITDDPSEVDDTFLPGYYSKEDCGLFVRLADFTRLDPSDLDNILVLESKPVRGSVSTALGGQIGVLYVLEQVAPKKEKPEVRSLDVGEVQRAAEERGLRLDPEVYRALVAALESGKHVMLTGAPGTAKTTLAEDVAAQAVKTHYCTGYTLTTATADWTTHETLGGLRPQADGRLEFAPGHFLAAIQQGKWLVIDELNRSNFDRAFGQLFTVLSGQSVVLPYEDSRTKRLIALSPDISTDVDDGTYSVVSIPSSWRIIATMNVFDKTLLFEMSFALMRRFAFIEVPTPDDDVYMDLVRQEAGTTWAERAAGAIKPLLELTTIKPLGPALFMDMARFASARLELGDDSDEHLRSQLFYSYLLPQFEGITDPDGRSLFRRLAPLIAAEDRDQLRTTLNTVLGLQLSTARDPSDEVLEVEASKDG